MPVRRSVAAALLAAFVPLLAACGPSMGGATPVTVPLTPVEDIPDLQPVDGGPGYFDGFIASLPTDPAYFPVGVWQEKVLEPSDLRGDRAAHLNTYVGVTEDSDISLLERGGSFALTFWPDDRSRGYIVSDEVDMWAGAGSGDWTGNFPGEGPICEPVESTCGYTAQQELAARAAPDGILRYANFGKGVTFWQTDEQASAFVNGPVDLISADNYWFTDPNICSEHEGGHVLTEPRELPESECRRAANYGWTVDRLRSLVDPLGSVPVWAFIEVGHPFAEPGARAITPAQIRAAAWSSIIHGARGIIYFNHSFGGECPSQHVLRDCSVTTSHAVSTLNGQFLELAPALNANTILEGVDTSSGIDVLAKQDGADLVVMAASTEATAQEDVRLTVRCAIDGRAEVLWEDRTVDVVGGVITDDFADDEAVHVYRLVGNTCGWE